MADVQTSGEGRTGQGSLVISLLLFVFLILAWHLATMRPTFNSAGLSEAQLMTMEFNGDIIRTEAGTYLYNPDKMRGIPGPWAVVRNHILHFLMEGSWHWGSVRMSQMPYKRSP
jgi:hypothetical protein